MQLTLFDMEEDKPIPKDRKNKLLSLEERQQIQILIATNKSLSLISQLIGRSKTSVVMEVQRNGGREVYKAHLAQQLAEKLAVEKSIRRSQKIKKNKVPFPKDIDILSEVNGLRTEIENLKMQIDILTDTIKQVKGTHDTKD